MIERRPILDFFSHLVLILGVIIVAFIGAVVLLFILRLIRGAGRVP